MPSALRPHVKTIRTSKIKRIQKTNFKNGKARKQKKVQRNIYVCKRENNRLSSFKQATRLLGWESDRLSLSRARGSTHRTLSHTHTHTLTQTHPSERVIARSRSSLIHWKKCKSRVQCCLCLRGKWGLTAIVLVARRQNGECMKIY